MVEVKDDHVVIKFGEGDIYIHLCLSNDKGLAILENGVPGYIGVNADYVYGEGTIEPAAIISFSKTESIDVVVRQLMRLKEIMMDRDATPLATQLFENVGFDML